MDVQHPELAGAGVPEPVDDADRGCDVGARAGAHDLAPDGELGLAFEDVERVDLVDVAVRLDALEVGPEAELDHLELGHLGEDPVIPGPAGQLLAPVGACDDPFHGGSVPYEQVFV